MDLLFEYVNIPKNNYFEYLVKEKLNPLSKKYPHVKNATVFFKVDNLDHEPDNICKIKLNTSNSSICVDAHEESIEQAIQKTSSALEERLKNNMDNSTT
ncbi:HPF/RaiA family ribosome-associated protein [Formosa haliotis]|uniref:HPF/RaiA family ribosome-associated protein n=1 Tax=Formosa haliotis TaxID=1555194 RepID=UPI000825C322|nr:HPF/RaiA family ribosome-associated protein [Formosa haliotis]